MTEQLKNNRSNDSIFEKKKSVEAFFCTYNKEFQIIMNACVYK